MVKGAPAPSRANPDEWVRKQTEGIARQHFPNRARSVERLLHQLAERHEAAWRSAGASGFRPTPAMYALALRWRLDVVGPTCAFCNGKVEVPDRVPPSGPAGPTLSLVMKDAPGGPALNVPQNLSLCHAGCRPGL